MHPDGSGVARGEGFESDIVLHGFVILSDAVESRIQKPQTACGLTGQRQKLLPLGKQAALQRIPVLIAAEQLADCGQAESHVLESRDPPGREELVLAVIAVAGVGVGFDGMEQADFVVMAQHTDTDSGQL